MCPWTPNRAVVVDSGSATFKVGFSGEDTPRSVSSQANVSGWKTSAVVGSEAQKKKDVLRLDHPVVRGLCVNWDVMEAVWHHAFYNELRISPEAHPVLLTEPAPNPGANREKNETMHFRNFQRSSRVHPRSSGAISLFIRTSFRPRV